MNIDTVKIVMTPDKELLINKLVDCLEKKLLDRLSQSNVKPIGLATGRTMEPVYLELVSRLRNWSELNYRLLLESWSSFNLDEYVGLKKDDLSSFSYYMYKNLFNPLGLSSDKIFIPDGFSKDPYLEASNYLDKLNIYGGIGLQLLGIGLNGHVGFNEPPSSPYDSCRVVNLSLSTKKQKIAMEFT